MSFVGDAIGSVVGGITGAKDQAKAAERAAQTQAEASDEQIAETQRQFDRMVELLTPFITPGEQAIAAQSDILGLGGPEAQQAQIDAVEQSPEFQALARQGEEAILANASATGNLRGGNTQAALAEFRPQLLNQLLQQRFANLGGLTQLGQSSAAGSAAQGIQSGAQIADILGQRGAALAGGQLARGSLNRVAFGDALNIGKAFAGAF